MKIECKQIPAGWTVTLHLAVDGKKELVELCSGSGPTPQIAAWWAGHHMQRLLAEGVKTLEAFGVVEPEDKAEKKEKKK